MGEDQQVFRAVGEMNAKIEEFSKEIENLPLKDLGEKAQKNNNGIGGNGISENGIKNVFNVVNNAQKELKEIRSKHAQENNEQIEKLKTSNVMAK